jgi:hypothetical protein
MAGHRYSVGDLVRVQGSVSIHPVEGFVDQLKHQRLAGIYEITRLLPELNGQPQYQIKSFPDGPTYVMRESQLVALPPPPPSPRR